MRQILSIVLGVVAWAGVSWLTYAPSSGPKLNPGYIIDFLKVVQPNFLGMLLHMVPGVVAGLFATRRHVMCGAVAAALTSFIQRAELIGRVPADYHAQLVATSVALALVFSVYGMAGGALGLALRGSIGSFKTMRLRNPA